MNCKSIKCNKYPQMGDLYNSATDMLDFTTNLGRTTTVVGAIMVGFAFLANERCGAFGAVRREVDGS